MSTSPRWILLTLLLAGCDPAGSPVSVAGIKASLALRLARTGLVFGCAHVVQGPDLIRGVVTVRNVGSEPIALVERKNSWGAWQWTLGGPGWSAGNPQHEWKENWYSEAVLAPGEVGHARFCITRSRSIQPTPADNWWFVVGEPMPPASRSPSPGASFARGQTVALVMDASQLRGLDEQEIKHKAPVWVGSASVLSEEVSSVQDLDRFIGGESLR
jgi:hypothetical protein